MIKYGMSSSSNKIYKKSLPAPTPHPKQQCHHSSCCFMLHIISGQFGTHRPTLFHRLHYTLDVVWKWRGRKRKLTRKMTPNCTAMAHLYQPTLCFAASPHLAQSGSQKCTGREKSPLCCTKLQINLDLCLD